ncbi:hypothetical protein NVP1101O_194 [Vibrio phage 1.101.O._10N.261.45.C6]|nr:hypothetical protein NVP1101O_194 [Vibrio phage 1.101.O._10N.261.45.C6]
MKARIIEKTIREKVQDWLDTLPLDVAEYVASKVVVTGGSIASMFLREPVNDYDIYFKNIKAAMMITRHYCLKYINEGITQKSIVRPVTPVLRLTFGEESKEVYKFINSLSDKSVCNTDNRTPEGKIRALVHPTDPALDDLFEKGYGIVERVEIFIQSQGFLGDNPDEEYDYFESRESGAAEEFIDGSIGNNTLINEEGLNEKGEKYKTVFMSSNAITLSHKMQLVIRFFGEPSEIHDTYDFVHAMNYWTKKEGLVTNTRALEALLSKELVYSGSKYPLASIFRTRKFIKREWSCHVGNYVKMAMQLNEMDLTDPYVLEEQLTGVDAAYLYQIIRAVKDKRKDDPTFEFNATYICTLVDRMMGESGQTSEDLI